MIRHERQEHFLNFKSEERHTAFRSFESVVPEMHSYSQDGYYVTSEFNDITNPIYNAFNSSNLSANLGDLSEVRSISIHLPHRTQITAIQVNCAQYSALFQIELYAENEQGIFTLLASCSSGMQDSSSYSNFLCVDENLPSANTPIENPVILLVSRSIAQSQNYEIRFVPLQSSQQSLVIKHIMLMDSLFSCLSEPLDNMQFNYSCDLFGCSFGEIQSKQCLLFNESYSFLSYNSSVICDLSEFTIFFQFYSYNSNQTQGLLSFGGIELYLNQSNSIVLATSSASKQVVVQTIFEKWNKIALRFSQDGAELYLNNKKISSIDGKINISSTQILLGCRQKSDGKEDCLNGAIAGIKIAPFALSEFHIQQLSK